MTHLQLKRKPAPLYTKTQVFDVCSTHGPEGLQPRLDICNLGNVATITNRVAVAGPNFGVVNEITRGGLVKVGMSLDF